MNRISRARLRKLTVGVAAAGLIVGGAAPVGLTSHDGGNSSATDARGGSSPRGPGH